MTKQNKIMKEALSKIINSSNDDVPEKYDDKYPYLCGCIQAMAKMALEKVDEIN